MQMKYRIASSVGVALAGFAPAASAASSAAPQCARTANVCGGTDVDGNNTNRPLADGLGVNITPNSVLSEGISY